MQSKAATVEEYLASLPEVRRKAVSAVREVILENLDGGYEEGINYGMIGYYVPHSLYPTGYHVNPKQPLPFACIGSQKNYISLYLMSLYAGSMDSRGAGHLEWFRQAWAKTGKKLDMGKSCIRFKKAEELALDVIGQAIRKVPAEKFIALVESGLAQSRTKAKARKKSSPAAQKKRAARATA